MEVAIQNLRDILAIEGCQFFLRKGEDWQGIKVLSER